MSADAFISFSYDKGPGRAYGTHLKRRHRDHDEPLASTLSDDGLLTLEPKILGRRRASSQSEFLDLPRKQYGADARFVDLLLPEGSRRVIYGRAARNGRDFECDCCAVWLQYWFFYLYNSKSKADIGLHEGDWEMIQVHVEEPDSKHPTLTAITLAQHDEAKRDDWRPEYADPKTSAPVIYVAQGSHASYLKPGSYQTRRYLPNDVCRPGGTSVRPKVIEIAESTAPWLGWQGRWGSSEGKVTGLDIGFDPGLKRSFQSPRGPMFQGRKWSNPCSFHRSASRVREPLPGDPEAAVPAADLEVAAARDGRNVVITVTIPEGADASRWMIDLQAVLTVGDGPPQEHRLTLVPIGDQVASSRQA